MKRVVKMVKRITIVFLVGLSFVSNILAQEIKKEQKKAYKLWYNAPAPNRGADSKKIQAGGFPYDADWENWSLPIGNGWLGASVFGRTDTERIQITENTLLNKGKYGLGSLTNFAEIYLDINHNTQKDYQRGLSISDAVSFVKYKHDNVEYSREYFASYPDKVLVLKLKASVKGKLSFVVRPVVPYLKNPDTTKENDYRTGVVSAKGDLITLSGKMGFFNIVYEGQLKIINYGGSKQAINDANGGNGKMVISNADSVVILVAVGTNYKLDRSVFTEKDPAKKIALNLSPHENISNIIAAASKKSYNALLKTHLADYHTYFNRVQLDFGGVESSTPTDQLLANYKKGIHDRYLEELYFQFGRYLLIASSRKGTMPANLQGVWTQYDISPWTSGYWHNINVQMNYWPAFNTNLAEMFTAYSDYNKAFREEAKKGATEYIKENNPSELSELPDGNGWTIGTGASAFHISAPGGHSGPGTGGFTTKLFWDQYDFTRDFEELKNTDYPAIKGMGVFLSKVTKSNKEGYLLADPSASPEQKVNGKNYTTTGCAFDQEMIYENHHDLLAMATLLGDKDPIVKKVESQIDKLDPILIGSSGQIKEFREEKKYGDIGEYKHRHISHLVGLYPGTIINSNTPAWMDAAKVTLNERGDFSKGWAIAHRMNAWARIKDGNRAYTLFSNLLTTCTKDNLWDTHPPFQIDGNFGGTAGIAEMLLQSHEGYIAPLPALTSQWKNGSYKGLVARGNFEVSATWNNGQATAFEIKARVGGICKVYYPNISKAKITDEKGNKLSFTKENNNLIALQTKKGAIIKVTAIPALNIVAAPDTLIATKYNDKTLELSWGAVTKSAQFNIYKAVGNAPTYELIESRKQGSGCRLKLDNNNKIGRCTIKVTKVDNDGKESEGKLAYINNN